MNHGAVKWIWSVPGKKKLLVIALAVMRGAYGASCVLYALLLRNIVDCAVAHDREGFWHQVILVILLVAAEIAVWIGAKWLEEVTLTTIENVFKKRLMHNVLYKDFASVNAVHSGEWLNRLTNDTVVVASGYTEIIPGLSLMVVKMVSAVIMMIALDWRFACLLFPFAAAMLLLTYVLRRIMKRLHKQVQERDGKLRIFVQEHIGSMMMIRSFAAEKRTEEQFDEFLDRHKAARLRKNNFSNICNLGLMTATNGMFLFGTAYCGYGILMGTITYGTLTAMTQLIGQIQSPMANISGYLPKFYAMIASAERLMEIERFQKDSDKAPLEIGEISRYYTDKLDAFGIRGASFTYYPSVDSITGLSKDDMPTVLRDVSVEIRKGDYTAFTGHSGCGKSTVLKLLMSIYKLDGGERYIRERDGTEKLMTGEWHRLFAYVPQGNQLMSGTIREIVAFSDSDGAKDDERIHRALKLACAEDFVNDLDGGIDTWLGERGAGLSEGQMQRIAIARAVYSDSPVLLLDEATSALDERTEKTLLENLRSMTDKTVVIVTHRPAALDICDRILEFSAEGVIEKR